MNIQWNLNRESDINPIELISSIRVSDNAGNFIEDDCIYLDSFFLLFSEGLLKLNTDDSYKSEIIDEPYPMYFERNKSILKIQYKGATLKTSYKETVIELLTSCGKLYQTIGHPIASHFVELDRNLKKLKCVEL